MQELILAILQARMSSTRLPGKVLRPLAGAPSLQRQLERIARCQTLDQVLVATSRGQDDDAIAGLCRSLGVGCFRGDLEDVLQRYYQAAAPIRPDHVVRLTADCPLTDWRLIDWLTDHHLAGGFDYCSNTDPRCYPKGLDVEIFTLAALERAQREATTAYQREHVTPYFYQPATRHLFRSGSVSQDLDWGCLRWTLDRPDDYAMIAALYERLHGDKPAFTTEDAMTLLLAEPALRALNADRQAAGIYRAIATRAAAVHWNDAAKTFDFEPMAA